ncbi:MAG: prepilin-type N-terminal cleavage/methylation domain-containing protein [Candidatus Sumerlaeia bacterium]|nr:prepilin-type N-terminal cleavage/methylation domain-containing protein [Candidatus Sumerlaeia bacterium]
MNRKHGFTLIELLIVVAIIAILAAIAVPNFLEAQVRAKVSAAKSDMRSLATALESYRVDNNRYVPTPNYNRATGQQTFTLEERWAYLTTPLSYITSIPRDPFGDSDVTRSDWRGIPAGSGNVKFATYDYSAFDRAGTYETTTFKQDLVVAFGYPTSIQWLIASQGPDSQPGLSVADASLGTISGQATGLPYDPTNGTVSAGDITYVGPGGIVAGGSR